jgi:Kef-type K+ transport system membrane component KefB
LRTSAGETGGGSGDILGEALKAPLSLLLLQLIVIIGTARLFGVLFRLIGQPPVVGEIAAGIILGPSVLGALFPSASAALFPAASIQTITMLSNVGLLLFMFVIGMELDIEFVKKTASSVVLISHASIAVPFCGGALLAPALYERFAPAGVPFYAFVLFMGIAMSITAFPVLARILKDRRQLGTPLGATAMACAALGDVTGWCVLAVIIAASNGSNTSSVWLTIGLAAAFVTVMLLVVRPLLARLFKRRNSPALTQPSLAMIILLLLGSAWIAEIVGLHALFGAFLAGFIMPSGGNLREDVVHKTEDIALVLLLPLFFASTGLKTQVGLLSGQDAWMWCGVIIAIAIAGKGLGTAGAAKLCGYGTKDSLALGALMNTRGLMELVVLNIGLQAGILSPMLFTMMVLMAILTTVMTAPLMKLLGR